MMVSYADGTALDHSIGIRMASRPKAPYLLVLVAIALLGGLVQPVVQGTYVPWRLWGTLALALALFMAAYRWRTLRPDASALQ
jgi:hypothetical protein